MYGVANTAITEGREQRIQQRGIRERHVLIDKQTVVVMCGVERDVDSEPRYLGGGKFEGLSVHGEISAEDSVYTGFDLDPIATAITTNQNQIDQTKVEDAQEVLCASAARSQRTAS